MYYKVEDRTSNGFNLYGLDLLAAGVFHKNVSFLLIYTPRIDEPAADFSGPGSGDNPSQLGGLESANIVFSNIVDECAQRAGRALRARVPSLQLETEVLPSSSRTRCTRLRPRQQQLRLRRQPDRRRGHGALSERIQVRRRRGQRQRRKSGQQQRQGFLPERRSNVRQGGRTNGGPAGGPVWLLRMAAGRTSPEPRPARRGDKRQNNQPSTGSASTGVSTTRTSTSASCSWWGGITRSSTASIPLTGLRIHRRVCRAQLVGAHERSHGGVAPVQLGAALRHTMRSGRLTHIPPWCGTIWATGPRSTSACTPSIHTGSRATGRS